MLAVLMDVAVVKRVPHDVVEADLAHPSGMLCLVDVTTPSDDEFVDLYGCDPLVPDHTHDAL